jgi:phosphoethanolamine N-methyltransferase
MQMLLQLLWGDGFLSPGGAAEVAHLLEGSDIAGCSVLDIGCGLGAVDELLITQHGARSVLGVDVDPGLLATLTERMERAGLATRVSSLCVKPGPLPLAADSFDVVCSKDAIVQMANMGETTATLSRAGFIDIEGRDRNAWYRELARRELAALEGELRSLVTVRIGLERAEHFIANWRQLVLVLERGELRPAHFKARKPVSAD